MAEALIKVTSFVRCCHDPAEEREAEGGSTGKTMAFSCPGRPFGAEPKAIITLENNIMTNLQLRFRYSEWPC